MDCAVHCGPLADGRSARLGELALPMDLQMQMEETLRMEWHEWSPRRRAQSGLLWLRLRLRRVRQD